MAPPILSRRQFRRFPVSVLCPQCPALCSQPLRRRFVSGATAQEACKLPGLGTATVAGVRDGRTLLLADGRELRLAAIEADDASRAALNIARRRQDAAAGKAWA